jgi:predicted XRE-type DNA-binding protein
MSEAPDAASDLHESEERLRTRRGVVAETAQWIEGRVGHTLPGNQ